MLGSRAQVPNTTASNLSSSYTPGVVPTELQDLVVYLQRELQTASSLLNNLMDGVLFPPTSVLPKRAYDGMVKLFIKDTDGKLPAGINKEGIYIYYGSDWHLWGTNV